MLLHFLFYFFVNITQFITLPTIKHALPTTTTTTQKINIFIQSIPYASTINLVFFLIRLFSQLFNIPWCIRLMLPFFDSSLLLTTPLHSSSLLYLVSFLYFIFLILFFRFYFFHFFYYDACSIVFLIIVLLMFISKFPLAGLRPGSTHTHTHTLVIPLDDSKDREAAAL